MRSFHSRKWRLQWAWGLLVPCHFALYQQQKGYFHCSSCYCRWTCWTCYCEALFEIHPIGRVYPWPSYLECSFLSHLKLQMEKLSFLSSILTDFLSKLTERPQRFFDARFRSFGWFVLVHMHGFKGRIFKDLRQTLAEGNVSLQEETFKDNSIIPRVSHTQDTEVVMPLYSMRVSQIKLTSASPLTSSRQLLGNKEMYPQLGIFIFIGKNRWEKRTLESD